MEEWQGFYTTAQVARIAGVPVATIHRWRHAGIINPAVELRTEGDEVFDRGYTYAQLTFIRLLRALRERQINFESAARALHHMFLRLGPPVKGWANERVYIIDNRIYVDRPDEWGTTDATKLGQKVETRLFGDLFEDLRDLEEGASILVPLQFRKYVNIDPGIMGGEPVVRGFRVPTAMLVTMLQNYQSMDKLASLYRPIPRESIEKAIEYERYLNERAA